jgi:hypothetical protein
LSLDRFDQARDRDRGLFGERVGKRDLSSVNGRGSVRTTTTTPIRLSSRITDAPSIDRYGRGPA